MDNELKEIAERLCKYSGDGWEITHADKLANGNWELIIQPLEPKKDQEATNDNN